MKVTPGLESATQELAHLRELVETTSDWLWEVDAQGRYVWVSGKVKDLLGYEPEALVGKTPFDLMPPDEAQRIGAEFGEIVGAKAPICRLLNVNLHKDGHRVVLETSGVPILGAAGQLVGYRGVDRDVSDRVDTERRLRTAYAALRAAAEGIVVADASGHITSVNHAFVEMTGLPEAQLIGRAPVMLAAVDGSPVGSLWGMLAGAHKWSGEGTCTHARGSAFPVWLTLSVVQEMDPQLAGYVAVVSDITERRAAEATIRFHATHDSVTQLANRACFLEELEPALRRATAQDQVGLLFIDLDGFKGINDRYGHAVGDSLLSAVARRLERCVRRSDVVARFGGDEFTVLLRDLTDDGALKRVGEAVVAAVGEPFLIENHSLSLGCSVGVAAAPQDGTTAHQLVIKADEAMYQAKRAGGSRVGTPRATPR